MKWGEIGKNNGWYIDEKFLVPKQNLGNPARTPEVALRAYWKHWYDLQENGQPFAFKRVGNMSADDSDGSDKSEEVGGEKGKEVVMKDKGVKTARSQKSDKERISFLRSLLPKTKANYHSLVEGVATITVSTLLLSVPLMN